jgi:acyl-CoA reductase-like NAD-dependent aldehyde dehydrogenase
VYESALGELELWNKAAAAQLDAQLRERRRNFSRRIEAIERIQQAASGLDDRIAEIESQEAAIHELDTKLAELTGHLVAVPSVAVAEQPQLLRA